jgi:hypothetical protein
MIIVSVSKFKKYKIPKDYSGWSSLLKELQEKCEEEKL